MTATQHTPGPWTDHAHEFENGGYQIWITGPDGKEIIHWQGFDHSDGRTSKARTKARRVADAAFIVRACNKFDALATLLTAAIDHIDSNTGGAGDAERIKFKAKCRALISGLGKHP